MSKRRRSQLSVLVIPDDGSRTLEFKVSYWLIWAGGGLLGVLLLLLILGAVFFWQAHYWQEVAGALRRENSRLRDDVEQVEELAQAVAQMKQADQKLRAMLSPNLDLAPVTYSVSPASHAVLSTTELSGQVTTVQGGGLSRYRNAVDPRWTPSIWPVSRSVGWVTAEFDDRSSVLQKRHLGIDVAAPEGTVILATADGKAVFAGLDEVFGQMVTIDHYGAFLTRYGHNSALLVSAGEQVRRGQPIALVGNSGRSSGPHLHYEIWEESGRARNPRDFLPR